MEIHKFQSSTEYFQAQKNLTDKKWDRVWVKDESLDFLISELKDIYGVNGICHGVRNGYEVEYLRKNLKGEIFGTELVLLRKVPYVIEWDFHCLNTKWVNKMDFIYSNSLDHSYTPSDCVDNWMKCLNLGGRCFIEWSPQHNKECSEGDCFQASAEEYEHLFDMNYKVKKVPIGERIMFILQRGK